MNIVKESIPVHKHFLVIDSPIPFTLIANNGTDEVYRMAGAWRIDMWQLLSKEYFKQYPVFTLELSYDEDELPAGQTIIVRQSDIDLGSGIAGVNGQDVKVTNFSDMPSVVLPEVFPVKNELDSNNEKIPLVVEKKNNILSFTSYNEFRTIFDNRDKYTDLFYKNSFKSGSYYFLNLNNLLSFYLYNSTKSINLQSSSKFVSCNDNGTYSYGPILHIYFFDGPQKQIYVDYFDYKTSVYMTQFLGFSNSSVDGIIVI